MLNKIIPFVACFFLLYGNSALSSDCIKVKGNIHTNIKNLEDPALPTLGTLIFKTKWERKVCAIQGQIVGTNEFGPSELSHQIVCKDHSSFNSMDTITEFSPQDECLIKVKESTILIPTSAKYEGYIGRTTSKGTINLCTGESDFKYKGKLCLEEDY